MKTRLISLSLILLMFKFSDAEKITYTMDFDVDVFEYPHSEDKLPYKNTINCDFIMLKENIWGLDFPYYNLDSMILSANSNVAKSYLEVIDKELKRKETEKPTTQTEKVYI